jgi:hypothetical protein
VICRLLDALPDTVDAATAEAAEAQLLALARQHNPTDLAKLAHHRFLHGPRPSPRVDE